MTGPESEDSLGQEASGGRSVQGTPTPFWFYLRKTLEFSLGKPKKDPLAKAEEKGTAVPVEEVRAFS